MKTIPPPSLAMASTPTVLLLSRPLRTTNRRHTASTLSRSDVTSSAVLQRRFLTLKKPLSASSLQERCYRPLLFRRYRSSIFFSEEKGTAEENVYFKKEDEHLIKAMLEKNPELNPKYTTHSGGTSLSQDLHLVCRKHGVPQVSMTMIKDIQQVFETHGWSPSKNRGTP